MGKLKLTWSFSFSSIIYPVPILHLPLKRAINGNYRSFRAAPTDFDVSVEIISPVCLLSTLIAERPLINLIESTENSKNFTGVSEVFSDENQFK